MKIHISATTMGLLNTNKYTLVERGKLEVKGKGEMKTYFILSRKDDMGNVMRCPFQDILAEYEKKNPAKISILDKKEAQQKFIQTEEVVVAATRDPLPPIRKGSAASVKASK